MFDDLLDHRGPRFTVVYFDNETKRYVLKGRCGLIGLMSFMHRMGLMYQRMDRIHIEVI